MGIIPVKVFFSSYLLPLVVFSCICNSRMWWVFAVHGLHSLNFLYTYFVSDVNDVALLCALMIAKCISKREETLVHTQCLS